MQINMSVGATIARSILDAARRDGEQWRDDIRFLVTYEISAWPLCHNPSKQMAHFADQSQLVAWYKKQMAWLNEFPDEHGDRVFRVTRIQFWDMGPHVLDFLPKRKEA